jgi:hypothetical protein
MTVNRAIVAILLAVFVTSSTGCILLAKPAYEKVKKRTSGDEDEKR